MSAAGIYLSRTESSAQPHSFEIMVRVAGEPAHFVGTIRETLLGAARGIPVEVTPLGDRIRRSVRQDALASRATAFFAAVTLALAALGLYGVTAYSTTRRTGELGLRVALGASPASVKGMIVREALRTVIAGVVVGLPLALMGTRLIRQQMFGVRPVDAPSLGTAILVLVATALAASYLPARRAARVDPLEALRAE